jgi:hypothetical protein
MDQFCQGEFDAFGWARVSFKGKVKASFSGSLDQTSAREYK